MDINNLPLLRIRRATDGGVELEQLLLQGICLSQLLEKHLRLTESNGWMTAKNSNRERLHRRRDEGRRSGHHDFLGDVRRLGRSALTAARILIHGIVGPGEGICSPRRGRVGRAQRHALIGVAIDKSRNLI